MTRSDMLDRDLWAIRADLERLLEIYAADELRLGVDRIRRIAHRAKDIAEGLEES